MRINYIKIQFLLSLFLIAYGTNFAQKTFEGKVKIKISSEGQNVSMDYLIKGKNFKIELGKGDEKGSFIMRGKNMILLMPSQKMYMEIDAKMMEKLQAMNPNAKKENASKDEDFDINKFRTGKTKKILGYNCEQWIVKNDEGQVELWVTDELGNFMSMDSPMNQGYSPAWSLYLQDKGFFPMLVISNDGSKFEVVDVKKQSVNDSEFLPPADYKKMNIPGM